MTKETFEAQLAKAVVNCDKAKSELSKANDDFSKADADFSKANANWDKAKANWDKANDDWDETYANKYKANGDFSKADAEVKRIKELIKERNFCQRCGKRTADLAAIHTCTPPQGST